MGDQGGKIEGHVDAGIGGTEELAVLVYHERQVQTRPVPCIAQLVRRDGHRREGTRRFALHEPEALAQFCRDEASERNIVDE